MNKVRIELTMEEFVNLLDLVQKKEKELGSHDIYSTILKKMDEGLDESRKENDIQLQVKSAFARLTGLEAEQISNGARLIDDLHLTSVQIKSCATSFTAIARRYKPDARIVPDECEKQATVQNCIDLVKARTK